MDELISISKDITQKSLQLTEEYIAMDLKLRDIQSKLQDPALSDEQERELDQQKHNLKRDYERKQQLFDNEFTLYCQSLATLIENENQTSPPNNFMRIIKERE